MEHSPADLERFKKKISSRIWRMNNLYFIKDKTGKPVRFKLSWAQRGLMNKKHNLNTILKVRQLGMSTLLAIYMLDKLLFIDKFQGGIIDFGLEDAKKKLEKLAFAWDNLDGCDGVEDTTEDERDASILGAIVKKETGRARKDGSFEPKKSNDTELAFTNGSSAWAGTSLRGGTIQLLHISEYGKISFKDPIKAKEIREGALNTVAQGMEVFIESTHEGGKRGDNYDILKMAMENENKEKLSPMDWKYHFFSWYEQPEYTLNPEFEPNIPKELEIYFEKLKNQYGIDLPPERRSWYVAKKREQKEGMLKEYPTVAPEAFDAVIEGAIYGGIITELRTQGKIYDFKHESSLPFFTAWDIGVSDYTSIWLVQLAGREILWHDCFEDNGREAGYYVTKAIRQWERDFDTIIASNLLPHDANIRDKGSSRTYVSYLEEAGLENIQVVPRTPDIWIGINLGRDMLKRSIFHSRCGERKKRMGVEYPSPLDNMEGYRTKKVEGTAIQENPIHDATSHTADSFRTFCDGLDKGMVGSSFAMKGGRGGGVRVKTTGRDSSNFGGGARVIR
tara:strand:- start:2148 stop:3833 length:1686 start_codon:yes stop_codon:yes gene_type:complete